ARAVAAELGGVRGHRPATLHLLGVQPAGMLRRGVGAHLLQRPGQIDGGWPRCGQRTGGGIDVLAERGRERNPVRRGNADRRRAAHGELADRDDELVDGGTGELDTLAREAPLIEEDDPRAVLLEANDVSWF